MRKNPARRLAATAAMEGDLAVGQEAARNDADADVGMTQLGDTVVVIVAVDRLDPGLAGAEPDFGSKLCHGATRLRMEGAFGGGIPAHMVSRDLEKRWRRLDRRPIDDASQA
ncbi:hypothetical protein GCM10020258_57250 [Sphingomonas yabuuchiae]